MILNQETNDIVVFGEDTSKKAKISEDKLAKLQYLLTKGLYKDPISAVIVEWTNNGIDGIVQAGKNPIENPVVVTIGSDTDNKMFFSVKDNGIGLDDKDFENVCMNYLESTKENDNNTIGHFGLGMKSFLSLERPATFTCIKNGRKRKYLVYEGAEFVNYELIVDEDTDEESGVECKIFITNWQEKNLFLSKANQKLSYYDTAVLVVDSRITQNSIKRTSLFQWSTLNNSNEMHICLKDVVYSIDWEALGIPRIDIPIALRFGLDSGLKPTPSRESYITNEVTKTLILNRISEVATYLTEKYNETVKEPIHFFKALPLIDNTDKKVTIDTLSIRINEILIYSKTPVESLKVEGFKIHPDGRAWKSRLYSVNLRYKMLARNDREWKTKRLYGNINSIIINKDYQVVNVSKTPVGKIKEYLKSKYKGAYFVSINEPSLDRDTADGKNDYNYKYILNLSAANEKEWENIINEWKYIEGLFDEHIIDETVIEGTPEYEAFLIKREEDHKEFLKNNPKWRNPNHLNKMDGDITIAKARLSSVGRFNPVYDKKAYPINQLHRLPHVVIYSSDENKAWLEKLQRAIYKRVDSLAHKYHVQTALIGKRESTKLPNLHNFISMDEFLTKGNKQFRQIATAELIADAIDDYKVISSNLVVNKYLTNIKKDIDELCVYVDNHHLNLDRNDDVYQGIIAVAKEKDLWDFTIMPTFQRVLGDIQTLRFVSFLKPPKAHEEEKMKEFTRIVNQFLLFRKVHNGKFENYEIVKIVEPEVIPELEAGTETIPFNAGENAVNQIFSNDATEAAMQDISDEGFEEYEPEIGDSDDTEAIMAGLNNPLEFEEELI